MNDNEELDRWVINEWGSRDECPICGHWEQLGTYARYCSNCGTRLYKPKEKQ